MKDLERNKAAVPGSRAVDRSHSAMAEQRVEREARSVSLLDIRSTKPASIGMKYAGDDGPGLELSPSRIPS